MTKILIANRGEIAVRVIRACAEAGYTSVAVYADQDLTAMHVRLADEAHSLLGTTAAETYLSINAVLDAARRSEADAVHPGYGFLSESAEFAEAVEAAGLVWIGPTPHSIRALGDKLTARSIAQRVGAPLAAGTDEPLLDAHQAVAFVQEHGLPVVIKAAHGGGGRGMKIVRSLDHVQEAFDAAGREAQAAFGRSECFIERFLEQPRHVEVQIVGDGAGQVVVVGDRDCSVQRRNQKLIEEAPAPGLTADQRRELHESARRICAEVDYRGAGTVEFLLASDGTLSFLEVNTRLQVEHPVTEAVTGMDLVKEQFRIAFGHGLSVTHTPESSGHAVEFRINAEDPGRGFLPSPGRVDRLSVAGGPGVRWDAGVEAGDEVQPAFDSLMAKLVIHADSRSAALIRARRALRETVVEGPATVIPFARVVLESPEFTSVDSPSAAGGTGRLAVHTQWLESTVMPRLESQARPEPLAQEPTQRVPIEIDGRRVLLGLPGGLLSRLGASDAQAPTGGSDGESAELTAPAPGTLIRWILDDGAEVTQGQPVAVVDAMKMETEVTAHKSGTLRRQIQVGEAVGAGVVLATIEQ